MKKVYVFLVLIFCSAGIFAQTTVFTDPFTTSTGATYTTPSGAIGTSTTWTLSSSGVDWGARIDGGILDMTNDASVSGNALGWSFASTPTSAFTAPYNTTLSSNGGVVTWTFNVRVNRSNLAGFASGSYGLAFILAGSSTTANNAGTGYALTLGNSGATDPFRLVKYSAGLLSIGGTAPPTANDILISNTVGFTNIAQNYYSVKVTYTPGTNTWELFLRDDGTTAFADPAVGVLTSQGTAVDATYTGVALGFLGGYWQGSTAANNIAYFDNVKVTVPAAGTPTINVAPATLTGFKELLGVPSAEQTYVVDGTDLTTDIVITPPTDFEISLTTAPFTPTNPINLTPVAGTVGSTTIYVRMLAGGLGAVGGDITHTSTGATQKDVAVSGNSLANEPLTQGAITFGAITNSTIQVNFTAGAGPNQLLVVKALTPVANNPVDGVTYTPDTNFGTGDNLGGNTYAVYAGTSGGTVTVSGLAAGTNYHFAIYEYDDEFTPGAENYLISPLSVNDATTIDVPVIYTWIGGNGGSWTTDINWAPIRTFPATNDILLFLDGSTETVVDVPNETIGQLHVTVGTHVTLQAGVTATALSINGSILLDDLTVDATSALNIDGANSYSINLGTGTTGVIDGSMTFTGTGTIGTSAHKLTAADANGITFNSGSLFNMSTGTLGNPFGNPGTASSVIFTNGSVLEQSSGSNPFGTAAGIVTFQTGSLYKITGAAFTPSFSGRTYANVEVDNPAYAVSSTGGSPLNIDNLTITNGLQNLNLSGGINIKANISVAAGATLGFSPATASALNFNGTAAQSISNLGTLGFSANENININNAAGLTLNAPVTWGGTVTFTAGLINTTSANLLTLASGSSVAGTSNASFVNGPISKIGNTNFTFPVGKTNCGPNNNVNGYAPIVISNSVGGAPTDQYTAEYIRGNPNVGAPKALGIHHVSACDYWTLNQVAGASTLDVTLTWDDPVNNCTTASPYVDLLASLLVAHYDGASWDLFGGLGTATGTTTAGTITWPGVSVFSPFALGSFDVSNPLPITINYFKGTKNSNSHFLNWKVTCVSTPSATIEIERSTDAVNYSSIYSIYATAVRCQQPFDYTDNAPAKGVNYYRLKMTDANGKVTYSSIVSLINAIKGIDMRNIAPNPIVNGSFNLEISAAEKTQMELVITDMQGRLLQKRSVNMIAGFNTIPMNVRNLAAGTYQLFGSSEDGRTRVLRFVVQ